MWGESVLPGALGWAAGSGERKRRDQNLRHFTGGEVGGAWWRSELTLILNAELSAERFFFTVHMMHGTRGVYVMGDSALLGVVSEDYWAGVRRCQWSEATASGI